MSNYRRACCIIIRLNSSMLKVALVLGGAGNIGSAVTNAFLEEGSCKNVVITSRSQDRIDKAIAAVKSRLGVGAASKIIGVVGSTGAEDEAEALVQKVTAAVGNSIDFVVSAMGFPFLNYGPLISVSNRKMQDVFNSQFFPAFGGCRSFMPLVKNAGGGSYVFVTGGGQDMYLGPGTGVMTIGGSMSTALAKVIMKESAADGVCCTEVSFLAGVCPDPSVMPPGFTWLASADAGKALVSVATKRSSHVQTVTIQSMVDLKQVIANGKKDNAMA